MDHSEENKGLDEIFELANPNPEFYIPQFHDSSQISDYKFERMISISHNNPYQIQEIVTSYQNPSNNTASPSQLFLYNERFISSSSHDINHSFRQETTNDGLHTNIISFARSNGDDDDPINRDTDLYENGISSYGLSPKRACTSIRNPSKAGEHLLSERRRRERMSKLFVNLSKVVPGLKKMDKATVLEDAIEHLKSLQERVDALEELEAANENYKDASKFECMISKRKTSDPNAPEIKARVSDKFVLIQICCKKEKGLMSQIPSEMENMQLSVLDMSYMPFGESSLAITILTKMKNEYHGEVKDIVDRLEMVFSIAA